MRDWLPVFCIVSDVVVPQTALSSPRPGREFGESRAIRKGLLLQDSTYIGHPTVLPPPPRFECGDAACSDCSSIGKRVGHRRYPESQKPVLPELSESSVCGSVGRGGETSGETCVCVSHRAKLYLFGKFNVAKIKKYAISIATDHLGEGS